MLWRTFACGMILMMAGVSSQAQTQNQHFHFSAGYANLSLGGDETADDFDGWGLALRLRTKFIEEVPELQLGGSLQLAFYGGNDSVAGFIGQVPINESISDVSMFSPTLDLAWHQPIGSNFFVEPNIGIGWAWGTFNPAVAVGDRSGTEDGMSVRTGVVAGFTYDQWSVGVDFQYSFYWIDFSSSLSGTTVSDLDDRHDEMYVGLFVRYSF